MANAGQISTTVVRRDEGICKNDEKKKSRKILRLTSIAVPRVSPKSEREEAIASRPFCNVGPSVPFLGELSILCFEFEDCTIQNPFSVQVKWHSRCRIQGIPRYMHKLDGSM